jgi:hypothetical protein
MQLSRPDDDHRRSRDRQIDVTHPHIEEALKMMNTTLQPTESMEWEQKHGTGSGTLLDGLQIDIPSNYQANLGGEPRRLSAFEVKHTPGRL